MIATILVSSFIVLCMCDGYQPFLLSPMDLSRPSTNRMENDVVRRFYLKKLFENPSRNQNNMIGDEDRDQETVIERSTKPPAKTRQKSSRIEFPGDKRKAAKLLEHFMNLLRKESQYKSGF